MLSYSTPEEAVGHPNAHIIRRYLGSSKPVEPDMRLYLSPQESPDEAESNQGLRLQPGDQIILCSDGLTDLVANEEIRSTLDTGMLEDALKHLINLANQRGGHDNITIVAMRVPTSIPQTGNVQPVVGRWKVRLSCLVLGLLAAFSIILVIGAYLLWNNGIPFPPPTQDNTPTQEFILASPEETALPETATPDLPIEPTGTIPSPSEPTLTPWPVTPAATE